MNNCKKNILVIDENIDITGFIKQGLEYLYPSEYHVICVNCRKKCFEVLKKSYIIPDIILLDISMSRTNIWEVLNQLRSNPQWKNIHIIFLSEARDTISKIFGNFFDIDLIEKPFEIEDLKIRIEKVLAR